jgi:hypothetical protein
MLLHSLLRFALPPKVLSRERSKVMSVARQLLAGVLGVERWPLLKARLQLVFVRKILIDGCHLCRSRMY